MAKQAKSQKQAVVEKALHDKLYTHNQYGYEHQVPKDLDISAYSADEIAWMKQNSVNFNYQYKSAAGKPTSVVPIHPMCVGCQVRHILKYKDHPIAEGKPFQIQCNGVPGALPKEAKQQIEQFISQNAMDRERAELIWRSAVDPVAWAELMFGFSDKPDENEKTEPVRWYQKLQERCTAKRIVLRQGRRSGKTFAMCLKLLYYVFNMQLPKGRDANGVQKYGGPQIIVVTPFQAQLTNIFSELEKLLHRNEHLASQVETKHAGSLYIKSPFFKMEFSNKATISGFVTGVEVRQDGNAGGALRGQSADIIYIDEMDAVHENILENVVKPILKTWPHTMLFASSTPIGKAGQFAEFSKNRPDFREFYFPATVIPHWSDDDLDIKTLDKQGDTFVAEYMAEFVESGSGVFKTTQVYNAMREYSYGQSDPDMPFWRTYANTSPSRDDNVICIGIDWNKNAGTEFVVVKWDALRDHWWIAEARNISAGQFTSMIFKKELKRLNLKWQPNYIYADEGYGHHIIDDLLFEAHQLTAKGPVDAMAIATAALKDRLKKFNFSQKVEINNPVDGTLMQKTGKEFLVENAVRVFESNSIFFPVSDVVLRDQLLNYVVERRHASNGRPVYGMKSSKVGDHRLDALMLALGGIFLERDPVYSPNNRAIQSMPMLLTKSVLDSRSKDNDEGFEQLTHQSIAALVLSIHREREVGQHPRKESTVYQPPSNRSQFPGRQSVDKPLDAFEELYQRSKPATRYDGVAVNPRHAVHQPNRSELFAFRKTKRASRGTR